MNIEWIKKHTPITLIDSNQKWKKDTLKILFGTDPMYRITGICCDLILCGLDPERY